MSEGDLVIRDLSEADLAAWYFVNYPSYYSDAECREQVEYEILSAWDRECTEEDASEADRDELPPDISPYWLWRVQCARSATEIAALSMSSRLDYIRRSVDAIWDYRTRNREAIAARTAPSLPQPLPLSAGNSRARGK